MVHKNLFIPDIIKKNILKNLQQNIFQDLPTPSAE